MSDVIVKNMDMPEGCFFDHKPWHCPFYDALICTQLNTYAASRSSTRLPNCPLRPAPEWISVEERLPEDSRAVIIRTRSNIVGIGFYLKNSEEWVQLYSGGGLRVDVTHWMKLPGPPGEETT